MNRRRMPVILALAAVIVVAALCWLSPLSKTSQAAPAPSGDAAFKGKVLLVHTNGMFSVSLLEKAHFQKIGDRSCLVGKGAADGPMLGWYKGRTVWMPMEHVASIIEFDDIKDAKKAMKSGGGGMAIPAYAPVEAPVPIQAAPGTPPPAVAPPPPAR